MRISDWSLDVCSSDLFDETARFHALPEEEKLKIRQGEHYVGYVPPGGIRINTGDGFDNAKNKADLQSALHVGRDFAPDHPLVQAGVRYYVPQPWPENLPGFKEKVKEYFRAVETLGRRLLPVYAARSEEHTSELPSLMRNSYAVFCLKT